MSHWKLFYHFVWSTKDRQPTIDLQREQWLRESIHMTCKELGVLEYELGVMPDHVHMYVALPPRIAAATFMHRIKGGASHSIRTRETAKTFEWQRQYGAYTIHERQIPPLLVYIRNQAEHHASDQLYANLERTEREYQPPPAETP